MLTAADLPLYEWYDNSTITLINNCKRKAYFQRLYGGHGIEDPVGPGAYLGTCIHAALAAAQSAYGLPLTEKKRIATRALWASYLRLFGEEGAPSPRDWPNAWAILLAYLDEHAHDDAFYTPIEPELGIAILISPQDGDPPGFEQPWVYKCRLDGLYRNVRTNDLCIRETKTTSQNVGLELKRLKNARQPIGYIYAANEALRDRGETERVTGCLMDIIYISSKKREFLRDYIQPNALDLWMWRYSVINIIEEWRRCIRQAMFQQIPVTLATFTKNDKACTMYNMLCSFYEACSNETPAVLDDRPRNRWDPLSPPKPEL